MTILEPSTLETISYRQQGWNAIFTTNMEKLNTYMSKLWGPTQATFALGAESVADVEVVVEDAADATQINMVNNGTGTPNQALQNISGTGDDINVNNNFVSLMARLNEAKVDGEDLRVQLNATIAYVGVLEDKLNELLAALRTTDGNGVLDD